jgi:uncharacterized protein YabE (DUF348 family)
MLGYPIPRWLVALGLVLIAAIAVAVPTLAFAQKSVTVVEGDQTITIRTQADTVSDALYSAGLALFPEDIVQPPADSPLEAGSTITIIRAIPVEITEGGVTVLVRTHQQKIAAILAEAGKTVAPGDSVWVDGERIPTERWDAISGTPHTIRLQRAMPITVVDQNNSTALTTSALTVGEALAEANIALFVADGVTPPLASPLTPDLTITIQRSLPITVEVDGRALGTRTVRGTVAEVLADAGVTLLGDDYSLPALDEPPPADGSPVRVVRVVEQIVTETKPLPYETQYQALPELEIDSTQIIQAGAYGTTATRVRVRYENGVEVSRTPEDSWVAVAPQPRILGYGTKIVIRTLDTPDGPLEYWRAVRMYATSYSASRAGTPVTAPWYGRTRSGKKLTIGMVAIDLNVMPLGTRLYVPGYGYATAEDTGGGVKGKWIDLGYDDWNFINWHQYVVVYFLTPIPPADQIKWVIP